jgi:uncharacterized protein (TIGR02217 family)
VSNQVLPDLPGRRWPFSRAPVHSTTIKTSVSGREYRRQNWSYPRYEYKFGYEVLRQAGAYTELAQMLGFVNSRGGSFDSFLYTDADDSTVALQQIGVGNGSTQAFQLIRSFGGYLEPVWDVNGAPSIYVDGSLQTLTTHYTIDSAGLVTFVTAPTAGKVVAWTGSFYWRCRFLKDGAEFSKFMVGLWELADLGMITVKE